MMDEHRRRLPHFYPDDAYLFFTWRLWGSLPGRTDSAVYPSPGHAFVAQDRVLDRRASGPLWLSDSRIADVVARAILIGDAERYFYELCAWVVMPNHVHLLILPRGSSSDADEMAERINREKRQPDLGPDRTAVLAR